MHFAYKRVFCEKQWRYGHWFIARNMSFTGSCFRLYYIEREEGPHKNEFYQMGEFKTLNEAVKAAEYLED